MPPGLVLAGYPRIRATGRFGRVDILEHMEDLKACLRCGGELEHGSIVGQQIYLNWLPEGEDAGITVHGDEHLARGSIGAAPSLKAARCLSCGLGYFQGSAAQE